MVMVTIVEGTAFIPYLPQSGIVLAICTVLAAGLVLFLAVKISCKSPQKRPQLTYISFALLLLTVVFFALNNLIIKDNIEMLLAAAAGYILSGPPEGENKPGIKLKEDLETKTLETKKH